MDLDKEYIVHEKHFHGRLRLRFPWHFHNTDLCHKLRHKRETGAGGCTSLLTVLLDDNYDDADDDHDEVDNVKVDDDDEEKEIGLEAAPVSQ